MKNLTNGDINDVKGIQSAYVLHSHGHSIISGLCDSIRTVSNPRKWTIILNKYYKNIN